MAAHTLRSLLVYRRLLSFVVIGTTLVAGCKSSTESGPQPANVLVAPDSVSIPQHGTATLSVNVTDKDNNLISGVTVTFASANTQMVTVSNIGVVTSVGPAGSTSVIVKAGRASTTVPITITPVTSGITVTPDPVTFAQKTSVQLQAQVVDAVGTAIPGASITYSTSSPLITVSQTGLIQSLGSAGSGTITLTSGNVSRTLNFTITQVPSALNVAPASLRLGQHGQVQLSAVLVDAVGNPIPSPSVTWSSSDQNIVTVSTTGVATSVGPLGTATITARSGQFTKTIPVEVAAVVHPSGTTITTTPFSGAWGIGISSTGVILAPSSDGQHTARVDASAGAITSTITGTGGIDLSFTSSGATAYIANTNSVRVDILDVATNTVTGNFTTVQPIAVQVSRDDQTLYVGSGGVVVAYDLVTKAEKWRVSVSGTVNALVLHPSLNLLYATGYDAGTVTEINTSTNSVTRSFHVGGTAQEAAVSADGNTLFVPIEGTDLALFDLTNGSQLPTITGAGGFGSALTPDGLQLWVTNGGTVKIVDVAARTYQTLTVPGYSRRIVFTADGSTAVITQEGSGLIFVR